MGVVSVATQKIAAHTASTTRGFSGSPVTLLDSAGLYQGMYISGASAEGKMFDELNHNLLLTTLHPAFINLYQQFVLPHINKAHFVDDKARSAFDAWKVHVKL